MFRFTRPQAHPYTFALLSILAAVVITKLLLWWLQDTNLFALFYAAVALSSWYGGLTTGLLTTVLSTLSIIIFFVLPYSPSLSAFLASFMRLLVFGGVAILISSLSAELRHSKKRAETSLFKLRNSEDQYRRLLDTAQEGIWLVDPQWRTTYVNQRMAEMLGYSTEEMVGRFIFDFMDEAATQKARERIDQTKRGVQKRFDFRYRCKDGSDLWAIVSTNPIWSQQGEFVGALAMIVDVTDRKRAEAALQESEEQLRLFVQYTPAAVAMLDRQMRYLLTSERWLSEYGLGEQSLINRSHYEVFPNLSQRWQEIYSRCLAGATEKCEEDELIRPDGSHEWVRWEIHPWRTNDGNIGGIIIFTEVITERKQAEEQRWQSEERFHQLAENIHQIFWISEPKNPKMLYISPAYEKIWGRTCESLYEEPRSFLDAIYGEDRDRVLAALSQQLQGESTSIEYRVVRPDGKLRWIWDRGFPIKDSVGDVYRVGGIAEDITERKQAEAERNQLFASLQESEQRFRAMADVAPVLIWMSGTDKLCNYFNKGWLDFTGRTLVEDVGHGWTENVHPHDLEFCLDTYYKAFDQREMFRMEYRLKRFDGEYRWVLDTGIPRFTANQEFLGYIGSCIDISDRKRVEEGRDFLNQASRVLASSLDYATTLANVANLAVPHLADWCGVDILEMDGQIQHLAVAHVDPAKVQMARELRDRYPPDINAPRGMPNVLRTGQSELYTEIPEPLLKQSAQDEEHYQILQELGLKSAMCVAMKIQERTLGVITFIAAESGRRYNQEDLALAEELANRAALAVENARLYSIAQRDRAQAESANRMKDEFLATLSHELRTPLSSILGWAKLLRTRSFDAGTTAKALETIERNAKSQAQLIEDILDVSRIITGKLRLNVRPIELLPVVEAAIDAVRPAAEAKGIRLQPVLDPSAGPVSGDPDRLQQVVWNLLSNAIKFTPKGGRVQVRLERVNSHIEINVSDTGIGIESELLPYVFDRFRQGDSTSTRSHGGLGLGLAIVRHLVELHGGSVSVRSPGVNQGTTFSVNLPLSIVHQDWRDPNRVHPRASDDEGFEMKPALNGLAVLVVDDEPDARELVATILELAGAEVKSVGSVSQALNYLQSWQPDVLVSDIEMPGQDGYALIREVRSRETPSGKRLPAVALTAYARGEDRRRALLAGFQMHIAKPVEPAELVTVIASLAGRNGDVNS